MPQRQYANYHMEALRWYDHFLKGMDTRVLEGAPIQLNLVMASTAEDTDWIVIFQDEALTRTLF